MCVCVREAASLDIFCLLFFVLSIATFTKKGSFGPAHNHPTIARGWIGRAIISIRDPGGLPTVATKLLEREGQSGNMGRLRMRPSLLWAGLVTVISVVPIKVTGQQTVTVSLVSTRAATIERTNTVGLPCQKWVLL